MPIPRLDVVARAERIIKQFAPEQKDIGEGFAYQVAQLKIDPKSQMFSKRIPHVLDVDSGDMWTGDAGGYHKNVIDEQNITIAPERMAFIEESPNSIEFRTTIGGEKGNQIIDKAIPYLQKKFPNKPIIHPKTGKIYTTGMESRLANILGEQQEEQPQTDIDKRLGNILKPDIPVTPQFTIQELYKYDEAGNIQRKKPEDFINDLVKTYHVEPEFAVNTYNNLTDKETQHAKALLTPEMATISPIEQIPFTDIKIDENTLKQQYKEGKIGIAEVIAKRTVARLLDFANLAGYAATGSALSKLVPKQYASKIPPVVKPTEQSIIKDMAKEGIKNPNKDQIIEYEVTHNYDPDPGLSEQFRNVESIDRMQQIEGLKPEQLGQVKPTALDPKAGKLMAFDSLKKQLSEKLPPVKPVEQAAKESLDNELVFKNVDELIHHIDNSGWYTTWEKMDGGFRKSFMTSLEAIRRAGKQGEDIYTRFKNWIDIPEQRAGKIITELKPLWNKLNKSEKINAVNILDHAYYNETIKSISPKVQNYVDTLFKSTAAVTDEARNIGLEVSPVTKMFHTHRIVDMDKFVKAQPKIAEQLVKNKQAKNVNEALNILNEFRKKYVDQEFQGLEQARTLHLKGYDQLKNAGFDTDFTAWENYFMSSLRRIESIKQFGPKGYEHLYDKIADLAKDNRIAANIAARLFKRLTNRDEKDLEAHFFAKNFGNFNLITLGGQVSLMQLASIPNIYIKTMKIGQLSGLKNATIGLYKGMKSVFSKADRDTVEATGAMINNTINDIRTMYGKSWLTEKYFKYSGTNALDYLTRLMAVHSAPYHLKTLTNRLLANPNDRLALREAKLLDIDVSKLLKNKGNLPQNELDLIYKRFSDNTIGRTRPTDLPIWWTSPLGKIVTLYRKFAFFQHKFMKDNVWKEIGKGNVPQLLPWLGIQYPVGYLIGEARAKLSDRDRPKGLWKVIDNLAMVQGLGIFLDATMASVRGIPATERFLFGVLSDLPDLMYYTAGIPVQYMAGQLSHKDWQNFKKYWFQKATGGIPLFNKYFMSQEYPETKKAPQVRR